MLRQVSSRNHRSKGFKLKNALQICLLVVVTIWLLFQVKHSYDKKSEYEDRNAHLSIKHERGGGGGDRHEGFEFGRKGLPGDARIEDEASEDDDLEQELLKHGESDAIDEQDQGKDDDGGGGGGGEEPSVFEDAESSKEGANAAREESFRGDDVASAVVAGRGGGRPEERGDHSREARERSFNGDNVSSAVAHEDHLEAAESKAAGGENSTFVDSTSDGGSKDREVTPNNEVSSNSTVDEPNNDTKPRVDRTTTDAVGNRTETPFSSSNKTADREAIESPTNATTVSSNQIELSSNLNETTNSGSGSGSARDGNGTVIRIPGDDKINTGATTSSASSEKGEGKVEFEDTTRNMAEEEMREVPIAKIEKLATKSGEEAVLE